MRRAMLVATVVTLVAAGGGAGASTKRVVIKDASLSPVAAVIAIDDSVQWQNKGTRPHRVKSAQGTFSAFTLQPGKSKTVKFERRGCERYEVDDRLAGRILVGVSSCPGGTSPPPSGGGGGGGREQATSAGRRGHPSLSRPDDRVAPESRGHVRAPARRGPGRRPEEQGSVERNVVAREGQGGERRGPQHLRSVERADNDDVLVRRHAAGRTMLSVEEPDADRHGDHERGAHARRQRLRALRQPRGVLQRQALRWGDRAHQ